MTTPARTLVRLELAQVLRGRVMAASLLLLVAAGLFGVQYGGTVIDRQRAALAASPALQQAQHRAILDPVAADAEAGDQLYYLFFHTAHEPTSWAPFSLGQRDVHAYNLKVRILALHGQLYNGDLGNPLLAAFGNFDAGFVLVFLVPLLVIALGYNVWSGEQEEGTWDLVRSQAYPAVRLLAIKFAVRLGLVLVPSLAIVVSAVVWLGLPIDARLGTILLLTTGYVVLWFAVCAGVASLGRSSDFNVTTLLAVWVVWSVLGPALIAVVTSVRFPVPEALELTVRQRHGYHAAWDRPLPETMARFYRRYPEWASVPVPPDTYSNAWYYAMQQRGDDEAAEAAEAYLAALERRRAWSGRAAMLFPPALFQLALNAVARTDLDSHLRYLRSVAAYHESLKRHFFPVIFERRRVADVDWTAVPTHRFRDDAGTPADANHGLGLAGLVIAAVIVGAWRLRVAVPAGGSRRV